MKIKLIPFKEELIMPTRAHYNDAGIDCYAQEDFIIVSGKTVKIQLGFGLKIPNGVAGFIMPRSSMNAKGIETQVKPADYCTYVDERDKENAYIGVDDSGYTGNICVILHNTNLFDAIEFNKGDKICQLVFVPVIYADLVLDLGEERGTGGFGSTGK